MSPAEPTHRTPVRAPRRYFIWKFGARFSLKASGPSLASGEEHRDAVGGVGLERIELVHALRFADGLENRLDRQRPVVVDHVGDLERLLECGAVGDDVPDQPVRQGLRGGDVAAVSSMSQAIVYGIWRGSRTAEPPIG